MYEKNVTNKLDFDVQTYHSSDVDCLMISARQPIIDKIRNPADNGHKTKALWEGKLENLMYVLWYSHRDNVRVALLNMFISVCKWEEAVA